jgi:UDP-N-acetyl-D-mannosaminuronic acid transferase (WecB/TagA/CpsF family)
LFQFFSVSAFQFFALPSHQILGLKFFGGTSREAVEEITRGGGLLVAPAAPSMINLCRDEEYRRALLAADLTIADSGFMVLLWRLFRGENVPRISGLEHVKRLLEHSSVREKGSTLWVVPTTSARDRLQEFLGGRGAFSRGGGGAMDAAIGSTASESDKSSRGRARSPEIYVAPKYSVPIEDEELLTLVRQTRPRHIVIAVGGGVQDKLGLYLIERLDYRPAIHCIGAALGFLTGDQVRIPDWADKYYVGWLFRSLAQPRVFIPRFWSARKLPWLIWKYGERLPPLRHT